MDVILLRLDAPLMSFGSVKVDHHNRTDPLPYRAMLTGLVANALGLTRMQADALDALQARLRYAARRDRRGTMIVDYQTVDFDPEGPMASRLGWTTWGQLEERAGGDASKGTHIRYRHYLADAIVTVALTLEPADVEPSITRVSEALRAPARPLFLGRKCCIPSTPVWLGDTSASTLREALEKTRRAEPIQPGAQRRSDDGALAAIWPAAEGAEESEARLWPRVEDRDFRNEIHVGRRIYAEGIVSPPEAEPKEAMS